jgi:ABC-2 type transport system permease protein
MTELVQPTSRSFGAKAPQDDQWRPNPSVWHLLTPKWLTARSRSRTQAKDGVWRIILLGVLGFLFWAFIFGVLTRLLRYFKGVPEIGELLAGKLLGLVLIGFFAILLLSNVITALSSFFLAKDLDLLVSGPVDWLNLYLAKLFETVLHSSWMVVLMSVPMFAAYGVVYEGGPWFPLVVLAMFVPFIVIPSVVGSAVTLILVNVFPARRTRDILSVIAVLTAGGIVLLFRLVRPEQLARPEGFRSLVDFVTVLRTPTSPLLPSEWVQRTVMGWLTRHSEAIHPYMLWTTAAALVVIGALIHRALYAKGFSKAQESGQQIAKPGMLGRVTGRVLTTFGVTRRELLLKELRLFFRDTTQWSQLILLAVLVVVYVFNIKYLPLRGADVTFFLVNVVPFLNLVLAGFVLASIAARFIFPSVSLEGRTLWLLRSSPLNVRELLWAKFWIGTLPLMILALAIVTLTNAMLEVSAFMFWVSVLTITFMTFGLAGLAMGFGTLFPQFETENAAQIPTSFGGLLFMMASVALIAGVVIAEARPVYGYLRAMAFGGTPDSAEMILGFGVAAALCITATVLPIQIAKNRLEKVER